MLPGKGLQRREFSNDSWWSEMQILVEGFQLTGRVGFSKLPNADIRLVRLAKHIKFACDLAEVGQR